MAEPDRPNIVVMVSDDHGQPDCVPFGSKDVRTPNLQRFAAAGCLYAQAFAASPSCAPSRSSLLTGLMPSRHGGEPNHVGKQDNIASLPGIFGRLGYQTAALGKIAYNHADQSRHGFDVVGKLGTGKAVADFFAKKRDKSKPLAMFVGTTLPACPWGEYESYDPQEALLPPTHIDTPETRVHRARYYADIARLDQWIGEIWHLSRKELGDKSCFMYFSDHGAQWPFAKWNCYDAGLRVPMLMSWHGVVKSASTSEALVSLTDVIPTLLELVGSAAPSGLDGQSFASLVRGRTTTHRSHVFGTHSGDGNLNVFPMRCVRTKDLKYIVNLRPDLIHGTPIDQGKEKDCTGLLYWQRWEAAARNDPKAAEIIQRYRSRPLEELYDLATDPHEQRNLAGHPGQAENLKALRRHMFAWMRAQKDQKRVYGRPRPLLAVK